jgi:hypothetical protein
MFCLAALNFSKLAALVAGSNASACGESCIIAISSGVKFWYHFNLSSKEFPILGLLANISSAFLLVRGLAAKSGNLPF